MAEVPSCKKKQRMIAFVKWVRMLIPGLQETASVKEYWDRMTPTQRRRLVTRLAKIEAME